MPRGAKPFTREQAIEKFWEKVNKKGPHIKGMEKRCWQWTAGCDSAGYGVMRTQIHFKGACKAHVVSLLIHGYDLPEDAVVKKLCSNKGCVRPSHCFIRTPDNFRDYFWTKVDKNNGPTQPHMATRCWAWLGAVGGDGYGQFTLPATEKRKAYSTHAHRALYVLKNPDIRSDQVICHKCDNILCVRPSHLFEGTHKENARDKINKGRQPPQARGEKSLVSKLTDAEAGEIKAAYRAGGVSQEALAKKYGVSQKTVSLMMRGKTWTHV